MSYRDAPEYQLAERVLKAWEACPVDDNGFGETVVLARAYLAMVEAYMVLLEARLAGPGERDKKDRQIELFVESMRVSAEQGELYGFADDCKRLLTLLRSPATGESKS